MSGVSGERRATRTRWSPRIVLVVAVLAALLVAQRAATPPQSWTVRAGTAPVAVAVAPRSGRVIWAGR